MFIYLLQIREALRGRYGVLLGFAVMATVVWFMWAFKSVLLRRYRPWTEPHETTASIVIPVVDEPIDLFTEVLERILKQLPHQVIVVINGARNLALEQVCIELGVEHTWTETPGKRNAVAIGTAMATGDIVVLVDSDTIWTKGTLPELLKPFADQRIGGVTTKQRIIEPRTWNGTLAADAEEGRRRYRRNGKARLRWRMRRRRQLAVARFLRRWADWMENSRALYSMPAQSALGYVSCLPGRTIAFRRHILVTVMHEFLHAKFLGVHLEVSDDRHLTNLTLKQGYRTVYQSSSLVYTDAPAQVRKMFRQQLRWARGSQYNHARMLPWVAGHAPMLIPFFFADIMLPFLLVGSVIGWAYHAATHTGVNLTEPLLEAWPGPWGWLVVIGLIVAGSTLSMWLRQLRHLVEEPRDFLWMPAYILFSSFFLMPIRLLGFMRMAHVANWGTRRNSYVGRKQRRINPWATLPYLAAIAILGAEIVAITRF